MQQLFSMHTGNLFEKKKQNKTLLKQQQHAEIDRLTRHMMREQPTV